MKIPKYPNDFKDYAGVDLPDSVINGMIKDLIESAEYPPRFPFVCSGNILIEGDKDGIRICKIIMEWESK